MAPVITASTAVLTTQRRVPLTEAQVLAVVTATDAQDGAIQPTLSGLGLINWTRRGTST